MSLSKQKKIGVNEKCPCASGLKYQKCCGKILITGKMRPVPPPSEKVQMCIDTLEYLYETEDLDKKYKVIDVTHILNELSYKPMQIENYDKKVIMIAEQTEKNTEVFENRLMCGDNVSNIIVMYRGSYRLLSYEDLPDALPNVCAMIEQMNERDINK